MVLFVVFVIVSISFVFVKNGVRTNIPNFESEAGVKREYVLFCNNFFATSDIFRYVCYLCLRSIPLKNRKLI